MQRALELLSEYPSRMPISGREKGDCQMGEECRKPGSLGVVTETFDCERVRAEYDRTCTFTQPRAGSRKHDRGRQMNGDQNEEDDARDGRQLEHYWQQRYLFFSRMDQGCLIDSEGWYSVTPECIAEHIAQRCPPNARVLDGFVGVGGNAIAFARRGCRVTAVDVDADRLDIARHNAGVYGVQDRIDFYGGDFFQFLQQPPSQASSFDVIFLSPPWGGPQYKQQDVYRLRDMTVNEERASGRQIVKAALRHAPNVILYAPRNTALTDLCIHKKSRGNSLVSHFQVEQVYVDGRFKALCVYYGELFISKRQRKLATFSQA
jgi:trimethylguanosine synthase